MKMPAAELVGHLHVLSQSVKDFLDPWFESEALKVALATDGVIGTKGGPYTPGTAYVLLHHVMGGVGGKRGLWGFVRGGMGGVTPGHGRFGASSGRGDSHGRARGENPHPQRRRGRGSAGRWRRNSCPRGRLQRRSQDHVPEARRRTRASRGISLPPFVRSKSKASR